MYWELLPYAGLAVAATLVGFFLGRHASRGMVRARELAAEIEDLRKEHDIALAEVEAARHEWKRAQGELERYRADVVDHFTGTSEMLRDLTLRYRSVYDHLTAGARTLCPDGSLALEVGEEGADALPPGPASMPEGTGEPRNKGA